MHCRFVEVKTLLVNALCLPVLRFGGPKVRDSSAQPVGLGL
jgi:hypothetical protein